MIHNGICRNPYYGNNALHKTICYNENLNNTLNEEPFKLYITPNKYYCSQIPGLRTDETWIINNLAINPLAVCMIIEIITYQRKYSCHLSFLLPEITKIINLNTKYNNLIKNFIPKFTVICKGHQNLYKEIDQIALSPKSEAIIQNFASIMLKQVDFISQLVDYNNEVKKNDNLLADISFENSEQITLKIDNSTIIQKLKSSKSWISFYIHSITKISNCFPNENQNNRHFSEISKVFQCFLDKMQ